MSRNTSFFAKLVSFETKTGGLLSYFFILLLLVVWSSFWLYADARYATQLEVETQVRKVTENIGVVDQENKERCSHLKNDLNGQMNNVTRIDKNVERLLAQNEIILQQLQLMQQRRDSK